MFQLFLVTGVYGERVGDALGVMHLVVFTLLSTCAFLGRLQVRLLPSLKYLATVTLAGIVMLWGLRVMLSGTLEYVEDKDKIIASMQLIDDPTSALLFHKGFPNPVPLLAGESLLDRIRRRGVIRIGYNEDKLPFAYFNINYELVGFDVDMAHALAKDLNVTIEFVPFDPRTLAQQLAQDHLYVVMSGLVGTLERAETMRHTEPYMDVTLGLVTRDYRAREFRSLESLQQIRDLRIGFVDLSRRIVARLQKSLPNATLVELSTNQQFFEKDWEELDALPISAESGSALTLLNPDFEVVVPSDLKVTLPLFYAFGGNGTGMKNFLEHWISLRRKDGTIQEYYDHWILGKAVKPREPRWSVIRDVLHWAD